MRQAIMSVTLPEMREQWESLLREPKKAVEAIRAFPAFTSMLTELEREMVDQGKSVPFSMCEHWHGGISLASCLVLALAKKGHTYARSRLPMALDNSQVPTIQDVLRGLDNRLRKEDLQLHEMISVASDCKEVITHRKSFLCGAIYVWEVLRQAAKAAEDD